MSLTATNITDITRFYLEEYDPQSWTDAARNYSNYSFADVVMNRKKRGAPSEKCSWNVKTGSSDNTRTSAFFKQDTYNRVNLGEKASTYWAFQDTHMLVDVREPAFMSGGKTEILDYLKMQRTDMYDGFFEQNEEWLWSLPAYPNDGTSGDVVMNGIPYYVVSSSTAAFGFNGADPSGYTTTAGLDKSANSKLKNGTGTYATVSDMEDKLTDALNKCNFKSPFGGAAAAGERTAALDYQLCSAYKPWKDYQSLIYAANDNIGPDYGKYRGVVGDGIKTQYYRGVPWIWIDVLTNTSSPARNTYEPIYGLDWSTWEFRTYGDLFMKVNPEKTVADAHNVVVTWMDSGCQLICKGPWRNNFVLIASVASSS